MWDTILHASTCITGALEEKEIEEGSERIFKEVVIKNFPNLMKSITLHIQEAPLTPSRINSMSSGARHIKIKLLRAKEF